MTTAKERGGIFKVLDEFACDDSIEGGWSEIGRDVLAVAFHERYVVGRNALRALEIEADTTVKERILKIVTANV